MIIPRSPSPAKATAEEAVALRLERLTPSQRSDLISYDWVEISLGTALAGGIYPLVIAAMSAIFFAVSVLVSAWFGTTSGPELAGPIEAIIAFGAFSIFASFIGAIWAGIVAAFTLPVVYVFVASLRLNGSIVKLGAFSGGLIGYLCVLPIFVLLFFEAHLPDIPSTLMLFVGGPGLATVLGQLGGAWGGNRSRQLSMSQHWKNPTAGAKKSTPSVTELPDDAPAPADDSRPAFQFGVRHLLWISLWLSLLLSAIRLSGVPWELAIPLLLGWVVYQWSTLHIGAWLAWRLGPWWRAAEGTFHVKQPATQSQLVRFT